MTLEHSARQIAAAATQRLGVHVPVISKAVAYVTDAERDTFLTFTQPQMPQAGVQVPAGTVESGEDPAAACAREFLEETGYQLPAVPLHFARTVFDATEFKPEIHLRFWFWCPTRGALPAAGWDHTEPRDGVGHLLHRCAWLPLALAPSLIAGFGDLVPALHCLGPHPPAGQPPVA